MSLVDTFDSVETLCHTTSILLIGKHAGEGLCSMSEVAHPFTKTHVVVQFYNIAIAL